MKCSKRAGTIYRPANVFRKNHRTKLINAWTNVIYQRVPQCNFPLRIMRGNLQIVTSDHNLRMLQYLKFSIKRCRNVSIETWVRVSKFNKKIEAILNKQTKCILDFHEMEYFNEVECTREYQIGFFFLYILYC